MHHIFKPCAMDFFHVLTSRNRTRRTNRQLGGLLAFVPSDRDKLKIHAGILALFTLGSLVGANSFKWIGFLTTLPIAAVLTVIGLPPLLQDIESCWRQSKKVVQ
jgi:hypothetical protein